MEQEAAIERAKAETRAAREQAEEASKIAVDAEEQVRSITTQLFIWGPIFAILLIVTFVLALRKPRQQVIRVGKEYSQRISRRLSAPTGDQAAATSGVCLSGFDSTGEPVRENLRASELSAGEGVIIGRSPELCQVVIGGQGVSRRQVRMSIERGRIMVEDLNSTNGTVLNGRRLSPRRPAEMRPGDTIAFGKTELSVSKI